MKYSFDIAIQAHVYGDIEADSDEEAKEKVYENLRIYPKIKRDDATEDECEIEWELKEPCRGHVCNFYGGGIGIRQED